MLINKAISNLFSGVSQQPISTRLTNYAEVQENGYSTVIDGLKKRPNTNLIKELVNTDGNVNSFVHFIDRDETEKYVVIISNGSLKVYDLQGNEMTVNTPNGVGYLTSSNPYMDFAATTIADYTIITNKSKVVQMGSTSALNPVNICYIVVKANIHSIQYRTIIDGITSMYISQVGEDTISITNNLAIQTQTNLGAGYTVSRTNNTIKIVKNNGAAFTSTKVADGWGDNALICLNTGVANITDLPVYMDSNFIVKIKGAYEGNSDDYYVKFVDGVWVETKKDGLKNSFNNTTMPHKLVRTGVNTFEFNSITYDGRVCGDSETSKEPSFVGKKINDIFFHKNRLGLLSDENVILSRSGSYFNFWQQTKTALLDSDPIDVAVSSTNVNILKHATSFNNTLLIFSDNTQFQLTTSNNQPLTPKTITINPTTKYKTDNLSKPIGIGQDVYFSVSKGNYTGFMEYFTSTGSFSSEAADVTQHVPKYIPNNVYKLIGSSVFDILLALTKTNKNELYVYKFLWQGDEKAQTSWSVWKLNSDEEIIGGEIITNKLYLVIKKSNKVLLVYIDLQNNYKTDNLNIPILLDNLVKITGVYDSITNRTSFILPYASTGDYMIVKSTGQTLTIVNKEIITNQDKLYVDGNYTSVPYYIGNKYTLKYQLSELILKDQNNVSIYEYKLKLKNMKVHYNDTGYFEVNVKPENRDTYKYVFTGNKLGISALLGNINLDNGYFGVPLICGSQNLKIEIINDSFIPCSLQSIEWNTKSSGNFQRR